MNLPSLQQRRVPYRTLILLPQKSICGTILIFGDKISRIIVTSALPYVYSTPHLGNFIGSVLPADVYANYLRMKGEDIIFICGSDVHGTAIEIQALKEKTTPDAVAKRMHDKIKSLFDAFGCNFTYYGSTHTEQNKEITYKIFDGLNKNGYIVEVQKELPYCNFDKLFLVDRLIEGKCPVCGYEKARGDQCDKCSSLLDPKDLIEPYCTVCGKKEIIFKKTKNAAIDLGKLQSKVEKFVKDNSKFNWSKNAINESHKYFKEGLKKRDISRHTKWGFPVPLKGFEDQVLYVWFDAPIGYIGITKEWTDSKWKDYWMDNDTVLVQFMGKDNIVFHTILFPAMLMGSDFGAVLAHTIRSYEFLNWEGQKFSKSRGVGMDLEDAISAVSDPDYWRFGLIMNTPESADTDFTSEGFVEAVNKIMNGKIGNLVQRVLTLIRNNQDIFDAKVPADTETLAKLGAIYKKYLDNFEKIELREAQRALVEMADLGNSLISEKEPWNIAKKAKTDKNAAKEFSTIMNTLAVISYYVNVLMFPFIPNSSRRALKYFGISADPKLKDLERKPALNLKDEPKPIFEKLTDSQIKKIDSYS